MPTLSSCNPLVDNEAMSPLSKFSSFFVLKIFFFWSPKKQKLENKNPKTIVGLSMMKGSPYIFF